MFTQSEIEKIVFFDLETASNLQSLPELEKSSPNLAKLWLKRSEYLKSRFEENRDKDPNTLYLEKAALSPEFARIVCASFGRVTFDKVTNVPTMNIKSFCSEDEKVILNGIVAVIDKFSGKFKFAGHNIKRFDVPMMCKRLLINNYSLPAGLQVQNLKPWEMPFIDSSELWSFGAWQEGFTSLDLLSTVLEIPTPKDDIEGSEVGEVFWIEKNFPRISKYCEKDVFTVAQVLLKISKLPELEKYES